jgi:lysyl-tRNA synthetase class 2
MASLDEIRNERLRKLEHIRSLGFDPYPVTVSADHTILEVLETFEALSKTEEKITIAGRAMALRAHGGSLFIDLYDGTGKIQALARRDGLGEEQFDTLLKIQDIGDFLEIRGHCFITKRGEKTVEVERVHVISKSLRPLPEKWHGLQDTEERFRHRYLDILMNEEVRKRFLVRSQLVSEVRNYFQKEGS